MRATDRWVMLGLLIVLRGCQKPAIPPPVNDNQFLALGDSYTIGEAIDASQSWPMQLVQQLRQSGEPIDLGRPRIIARTGWTTRDLDFAIDVEDPKGPFQLVTLLIGVNNQFQHASIDQFRSQFSDLLKRAIGFAGGDPRHVIVLSIPDWGKTPYARQFDRAQIEREIDQFNVVCKAEAAQQKVAFVDVTGISRKAGDEPELVAGDGLHPSAAMYRLWVEKMLPQVRAALASQPATTQSQSADR